MKIQYIGNDAYEITSYDNQTITLTKDEFYECVQTINELEQAYINSIMNRKV
jgi:hypothetical protein